jgi:hypothetical protein
VNTKQQRKITKGIIQAETATRLGEEGIENVEIKRLSQV